MSRIGNQFIGLVVTLTIQFTIAGSVHASHYGIRSGYGFDEASKSTHATQTVSAAAGIRRVQRGQNSETTYTSAGLAYAEGPSGLRLRTGSTEADRLVNRGVIQYSSVGNADAAWYVDTRQWGQPVSGPSWPGQDIRQRQQLQPTVSYETSVREVAGPSTVTLVNTRREERIDLLSVIEQFLQGPVSRWVTTHVIGNVLHTTTVTSWTEIPISIRTMRTTVYIHRTYRESTPYYQEKTTTEVTRYSNGRETRTVVSVTMSPSPIRWAVREWTATETVVLPPVTSRDTGVGTTRELRTTATQTLNRPPVALFEVDSPVRRGQPVRFVDRSYDPDPGDRLAERVWGGDRRPAYLTAGRYPVTLRVRDEGGLWSEPAVRVVEVLDLGLEVEVRPAVARRGERVLVVARPDFPADRVLASAPFGDVPLRQTGGGRWEGTFTVPATADEGAKAVRATGWLGSASTTGEATLTVRGSIAEEVQFVLTD